MPRSRSPCAEDRSGVMEQLEPETDNDIDVRDFSERPTNEKRSPKPIHKPKVMIQNFFPSPLACADYIVMNAATAGIAKPHSREIRGILPKKKKVPQGWPTCLKGHP